MRLLRRDENGQLVSDVYGTVVPEYVVLSHTWLVDEEEVKLGDIASGTAAEKTASYRKLLFCDKQAAADHCEHFWIDNCCINKDSSAEIQEAITAMYKWYRNAKKCYVYLADVSITIDDIASPTWSTGSWMDAFRRSRWFTRGWTLQELLAPGNVEFYSAEGIRLGDKKSLKQAIHEITNIPMAALESADLTTFSPSERLSWARHRKTTRTEDQAYCLLGIFEIYMPLIYGEEDHAMVRLQDEIEKKYGELAEWDELLANVRVAHQAAFNSLDNQHGSTCLMNTRIQLLQDISEWANSSDERSVYWLNGIAGTGKSTVARTIARKFQEQGILGGSFFFSKGGGEVSHANLLFTTLALQLSASFPTTRRHIAEAIKKNKDIALHSYRDQWDQLIMGPLKELKGQQTDNVVFVLDALDECDNEKDIRVLLRLLSGTGSLQGVKLKVLVTSRPEVPIRLGISQIPATQREIFHLHNILPTLVDSDLSLFFQQNLAAIREERGLAATWPGHKIIAHLVRISCGLFIWASTACRYIREGKRFAVRRLETLLRGRSSDAGPEKQLDAIYSTVLEGLIQPHYDKEEKKLMCETTRAIVGSIVTLIAPLSAQSLAHLLDRPIQEVDETLQDLHTIFNVPESPHRPIRLHHPTFRDYLADESRCTNRDFSIDQKKIHKALADHCVRIMRSKLKRDICDLKSPGSLVSDAPQSRIDECIPPEVQYACIYWAQHYRQSGVMLKEDDASYAFLREHYLHWLEAMSLMGRSSDVAAIVRMYQAILLDAENTSQLEFLKDARRFNFSFQGSIEQAPLQAYSAGLIFAQSTNALRRHFWKDLHPWFRRVKFMNAISAAQKDEYMFVNDLAFTPDGAQIASASIGPFIRIWNVSDRSASHILQGQRDKTGSVAIAPDGSTVASGSDDATIMVWDRESRLTLCMLEGHTRWVNTVIYSPDGKFLASGSMDETIRLWDIRTGAQIKVLEGDLACVNAIAFSSDGKALASATSDWMVRIWDIDKAEVKALLDGHSGPVNAVQYCANGSQVASGSDDRTVKIWNLETMMELHTLRGHLKKVNAVTFSSDASRLASGSEDRSIRLWDAVQGACLAMLEGHLSGINSVCFSPEGQALAAGAYNDELRIWNVKTGEMIGKFDDFPAPQSQAPLPSTALSQSSYRGPLPEDTSGHASAVVCLTLSADRQTLASGSTDGSVCIWDRQGTNLARLHGHTAPITQLAFHSDGLRLLTVSRDNTLIVWSIPEQAPLATLTEHTDLIQDLVFSPDGRFLATCSADKTIRLWDSDSFSQVCTLADHSDTVTTLSFSQDSRQLASTAADGEVVLWTLSSTTPQAIQVGSHDSIVLGSAFSPTGDCLASCSADTTIKLWSTAQADRADIVANLEACKDVVLEGHTAAVNAVAFMPGAKLLVSCSDDGTVRFWDRNTNAECARLEVSLPLHKLRPIDDTTVMTDRGALRMGATPMNMSSLALQEGAHLLFVDSTWVKRDGENMLWLSEGHRVTCIVADDNVAVLGHETGSLTFISV